MITLPRDVMIAVLIPDEDGTSAGEERVVWDKNNDCALRQQHA